jgi:hypothetical protein
MVGKKMRNLDDHALKNRALLRNNELVSDQTYIGKDTSRPLVFNSVLKSYVLISILLMQFVLEVRQVICELPKKKVPKFFGDGIGN